MAEPIPNAILVTPELLRKYDRPGPRYTSYPTAVEFSSAYDASAYFGSLDEAAMHADDPLSLYVHLPFCEHRCTFCGCNVVITQRRSVAGQYLTYVHREVREVARRLRRRRKVVQYHWGGGTPTYLTVNEMRALQQVVAECFDILPDAESAIEVDPRVTSCEQIDLLRSMGFNRLSMGVQDFDPEVQAIISRNQTESQTRELFAYSRSAGFASINIDLIYGLPLQKAETFAKTLDTVIELRADRVAVYSYAHVPWLRTQQKGFDPALLPSAEQKLELFCLARDAFLQAGYRQIGMDHFAVPEDELARAVETRTLSRNFMGYTVKAAPDMIGVGVSAIGDVAGCYAQNQKKLPRYYDAIDKGSLPIDRGYRLSDDDRVRRFVINQLMCNFHLDKRAVEERFGIAFDHAFERELAALASPDGLIANGFVTASREALHVEPLGRLFVRNVAMLFDRFLLDKKPDARIFSRTV
jgi:oxygen-independent coproporphyrinogen-3 oxidase